MRRFSLLLTVLLFSISLVAAQEVTPTVTATPEPTLEPTAEPLPTDVPTLKPTETLLPTEIPTEIPTATPTSEATLEASITPIESNLTLEPTLDVTATATLEPTLTPTSAPVTQPTLPLLFSTDFEAGIPTGIASFGDWLPVVNETGNALQPTAPAGFSYTDSAFGDVEIALDVQLIAGKITLARTLDEQGYALSLDDTGRVEISKNGEFVNAGNVILTGEAVTLRLSILGNTISAYADDVLLTTATDSLPIASGFVVVNITENTLVRVDNLALYAAAAPIVTPTPTVAPELTPTATPEVFANPMPLDPPDGCPFIDQVDIVSVDSSGNLGNRGGESTLNRVSVDGRYVAFTSRSNNLSPDDTDIYYDIFRHDRLTCTTIRVGIGDVDTAIRDDNDDGIRIFDMSDDGNLIVFQAYKLGGNLRIYLRNVTNATTEIVSLNNVGVDVLAINPVISGNGGYVGFITGISIDVNDTNGDDFYLRDLTLGQTEWINDGELFYINYDQKISDNGRFVGIYTIYPFDPLDTIANTGDLYVYDRDTSTYLWMTPCQTTFCPQTAAYPGGLRFMGLTAENDEPVAYFIKGDDISNIPNEGFYIYEYATDAYYVIGSGLQDTQEVALSNDGAILAYTLRSGGITKVYVLNLATNQSILAVNGNRSSSQPALSGDGSTLAVTSYATNLVSYDTVVSNDCRNPVTNLFPDNCQDVFTKPLLFPAPAVPALVAPANAFLTKDDTPLLDWNAVTNAYGYTLQISTVSNFATLVSGYPVAGITATDYTPAALLDGTYYWRVRSESYPAVTVSAYSAARSFTVDTTALTIAPTLTTPVDNAELLATRPPFAWSPVGGAASYKLQIATDMAFTSNVLTFTPTTASFTIPTTTPALTFGSYYWRVLAKDAVGNDDTAVPPAPWSSIYQFYVVPPAPVAPVLVAPTNIAIINDATPAFDWNAATNGATYELQVATNNTFTTMVSGYPLNGLTSTEYTPTTSLLDGNYFWRVRAFNSAPTPIAGPYSLARSFTVDTVGITTPPTILSPVENAAVLYNNATFSWTSVTGAARYRLELSEDPAFAVNAYTFAAVTTTSYTAPTLIGVSPGPVYARVIALDAAGNDQNALTTPGVFSSTRTFIVTTSFPTAPTFGTTAIPSVGALVSAQQPAGRQPTDLDFSWNAVTVDSGPFTYQLQLNLNDAVFATVPELDTTTGADEAFKNDVNISALPDGTYSWRVRGINTNGVSGPFSAVRSFIKDTTRPAAPLLNAPAQNALVTATRPPFSWGIATTATSYRLDVSADSFASFVNGYNNRPVTSPSFTGAATGANAVDALTPGVYQWRVRAVDAAGNISLDSLTGTFVAHTTALTAPVITTLEGAATGSPFTADTQPEATVTTTNPATLPGLPTRTLEVQFSTTSTFTAIVPRDSADLTLDDTDWGAGPLNPTLLTQPLFVRARLKYSDGTITVYSPFSATRNFTLDQEAPLAAQVTAPAANAVVTSVRPTITWAAVAGAVSYQLYVDDILYVTSPAVLTTTTYTIKPTDVALAQGNRFVHVLAKDAAGNESVVDYSRNRIFSIFIGTTPAANAVLTTPNITFNWASQIGATSYALEISTNPNFTAPIAGSPFAPLTPTALTRQVLGLLPGTYYWRVAVNGVSPESSASRTLIINNSATLPLATTNPVEPVTAAEIAGTAPSVLNAFEVSDGITFTWNPPASLPTGATIAGYKLQVSTSSAFPATAATAMFEVGAATTNRTLQMFELAAFNFVTPSPTPLFWRVQTVYTPAGVTPELLTNSLTRNLTVDNVLPNAPTITTITVNSGLFVNSVRPTISWTAPVGGAARYEVTFMGTSILTASVTVTNYTPPATIAPLLQTSNTVEVYAFDAAGNQSASAAQRTFDVNIARTPASGTVISAASAVATTATSAFTWQAVAGATSYTLEVDNDSDFSSPLTLTGPAFTATATTRTINNLPFGTLFWRVKYSTASITDNAPLNGYTLFVTPLGGLPKPGTPAVVGAPIINYVESVNQTGVTVNWTAPTALGGITLTGYKVQVATATTFAAAAVLHDSGILSDSLTTYAIPYAANLEGARFVRVTALYNNDAVGISLATAFTVDTVAPAAPNLTAPVNATVITAVRPTFSWAAAATATSYRLDVSNDSFATTLTDYTNRTVATASFTGTATGANTVAALPVGLYQWRVRAVDANGNLGVNSATGVFYVNATVVTAPVITTLKGLATGTVITNDQTPDATLTPAVPVSLAGMSAEYQVQFSTSSTFAIANSVVSSDNLITDADWLTALAVSPSQPYFVRARVVYTAPGGTVYSPFSVVRNFTLDTVAPNPVVTLNLPVDNALVTTRTPTFTWAAATGGATRYDWQIGTTSNFAGLGLLSQEDTTLSRTVPTPFGLADGVYYWRVVAVDAAGNRASASVEREFTVDAP